MFCVLSFRASGGAPSPQTSPYIAPHLHHLGTPGLLDSDTVVSLGCFLSLVGGVRLFYVCCFLCLFDCFGWSSPCLCGDIGVLILFCVRRFFELWMDRYIDIYGLFMQFFGASRDTSCESKAVREVYRKITIKSYREVDWKITIKLYKKWIEK